MNKITYLLLFILVLSSVYGLKVISPYPITGNGNTGSCTCTDYGFLNKSVADTLYYPLITNPFSFFNITTIENSNIATKNLTVNSYIFLNKISGICDLSVNGTICSNATGTYIIG